MKHVCMTCKREKVVSGQRAAVDDTNVSHGLCSRCLVFQEGGEFNLHDQQDREDLKKEIARELNQNIVWEGEYLVSRPEDEYSAYAELINEVKRERGEGHLDAKR